MHGLARSAQERSDQVRRAGASRLVSGIRHPTRSDLFPDFQRATAAGASQRWNSGGGERRGWCQGRNRVSRLSYLKVAYSLAFRPGPYQQQYHHDVLMCGLGSVRAAWFWIQVAVDRAQPACPISRVGQPRARAVPEQPKGRTARQGSPARLPGGSGRCAKWVASSVASSPRRSEFKRKRPSAPVARGWFGRCAAGRCFAIHPCAARLAVWNGLCCGAEGAFISG